MISSVLDDVIKFLDLMHFLLATFKSSSD